MVFLTGDVHHKSLGTPDQKYLKITEVEAAKKFISIAAKYDIKATLFLSGRTFIEEWSELEGILKYNNLEIGGHTWNCFRFTPLHYLSELLTGSFYGPEMYQSWDIKRTLQIIKQRAGYDCISWRGHAYRGDTITYKLLANNGVKVVSNQVEEKGQIKKLEESLISLPINTMVDHDHIYHGRFTEEFIEKDSFIRDNKLLHIFLSHKFPSLLEWKRIAREAIKRTLHKKTRMVSSFGKCFFTVKEWFKHIKQRIPQNIEESGFATILVHPACMEIIDGMRTLEKLCIFLRSFDTKFCKETVEYLNTENKV